MNQAIAVRMSRVASRRAAAMLVWPARRIAAVMVLRMAASTVGA